MSVLAGLLGHLSADVARASAQSTASALLAGLWQSTLLVVAVFIAFKVMPRTTAAWRFIIWTAVFCVSVAAPFAGLILESESGAEAHAVHSLRVDPRWSYGLAGIWILAALLRFMQLAAQGWKLVKMWRRAVPIPENILMGLDCADLLRGRMVQICISDEVDRPGVIGFFAPKILVPAWLFQQLSASELQHIVLHELEHLRRRDDWINLMQRIGLIVIPLNPALFWVDRRLATEREIACDDGVLQRTQMRRAYATCLASIAEMRLERRMHRRMVALALGVFGNVRILQGRSEFSRRIESILSRRAVASPVAAAWVAGALMLGVLTAGVELARVPNLVSFAPVSQISAGLPGTPEGIRTPVDARARDVAFRMPQPTIAIQAAWTQHAYVKNISASVPRRSKSLHNPSSALRAGRMAQSLSLVSTGERMPFHIAAVSKTGFEDGSQILPRAERPDARSERSDAHWMVLTSSDQDAPARVVVKLKDGRLYLAPYAAVPIRDGWLIVQL